MSRRLLQLALALSVSLGIGVPVSRVLADDAAPELENAKHQYLGVINGNSVLVRSGPSDSDYPTVRLDKGTQVTVVGMRYNWLKIVPPEGSFSYVAKLYVERHGDGTSGRVTKDGLSVWVGSSLTTVKSAAQGKLNKGTEVSIMGEAEEYYKIKPPADAYVWVNQNLVAPVRQIAPETTAQNPTPNSTAAVPVPVPVPTPTDPNAIAIPTTVPSTQQTDTQAAVPVAPPTTMPAIDAAAFASAAQQFDTLEESFKNATNKPLDEQAPADLVSGYEKLLASDALAPSMRRIAEARIAGLKLRVEARDKLLAVRKDQEVMTQKLSALRAERGELEEKVQQIGIQIFTAVGTLQTSSLQVNGQALYRLTDPASGRTVCYIRTSDVKINGMMGQFMGVRGQLVDDKQLSLKVVNATEFLPVDQAKVNKGVSAQIVPPSLMTRPVANTETAPRD